MVRATHVLASAVFLLAACGGGSASTRAADLAPLMTVEVSGDQVVEKADLNGDGKPDVWNFYRETSEKDGKKTRTLVRKAVDINGDGRLDVTTWFDDNGEVVKEEMDLDYDGRADKIRYLKKGKVEREELSSRFDGQIDVKKFYEDGVLVVKQVDTRHVGQFDEFQYFVGNKLSRIGWDRDGDGKPEVFEENPAMAE